MDQYKQNQLWTYRAVSALKVVISLGSENNFIPRNSLMGTVKEHASSGSTKAQVSTCME